MEFNMDFKPITVKPQEIEDRSFEIIEEEMGSHPFDPYQFKVVQRVIHASADFDLGRSLVFHPQAIESGIAAIRAGKTVFADVQMIQAGISKPRIEKYGGEVKVYISDDDVIQEAKRLQLTRAIIATRKAVEEQPDGIFVIGNAPTALLELIRLIKEGQARPSLVVGMPVGFVSAAESKEELVKLIDGDVPFITNIGRKGGSPVSVAAMNALSLLADQIG